MLIFHELHKLLSGKTKWLLLILLLVNSFVFYLYMMPYTKTASEKRMHDMLLDMGRQYPSMQQAMNNLENDVQVCAAWSGVDQAKAEWIQMDVKNEYQQALEFDSFINGFQERAQDMLDFSIFAQEGSFSRRNILKTADDFLSLQDLKVSPADGTGLLKMQGSFLSDVFMLVVICFLSFQLFGMDATTGINKVIRATPRGEKRLLLIQMGLVGLCSVGCAALLYGSNILQTAILAGFPSTGVDIHGMSDFRNIPYACTVGQYLAQYMGWKMFYAFGLSFLVQLIAYKLQGSKTAWMLIGGLAAVSFLLWFYLPPNPIAKIFRYLNVIGLADTAQIVGNYQNLNLFGFPVELRTAASLMLVLFVAAAAVLIVWTRPIHLRLSLLQREKSLPKKSRRHLLTCELVKAGGRRKAAVLLLTVLAYGVYDGVLRQPPPYVMPEEYYYQEESKDLVGKSGAELQAAMKELEKESENFSVSAQMEVFFQIQQQYQHVLQDPSRCFVNASNWEQILFSKQAELVSFMIFALASIFSVNGIFQVEYSTRMKSLISSSRGGGKVYWYKLICMALQSVLFTLILQAGRLVWCARQYGFAQSDAPAQSLPMLAALPFDLSLRGMVVLMVVQRVLAGLIVTMLLFVLAQFLLSSSQFVIGGAVLFVLPGVLLYISNMQYINPLISVLQSTVAPRLTLYYALSSWPSVLEKVTPAGFIAMLLGAAALTGAGYLRWQKK